MEIYNLGKNRNDLKFYFYVKVNKNHVFRFWKWCSSKYHHNIDVIYYDFIPDNYEIKDTTISFTKFNNFIRIHKITLVFDLLFTKSKNFLDLIQDVKPL